MLGFNINEAWTMELLVFSITDRKNITLVLKSRNILMEAPLVRLPLRKSETLSSCIWSAFIMQKRLDYIVPRTLVIMQSIEF